MAVANAYCTNKKNKNSNKKYKNNLRKFSSFYDPRGENNTELELSKLVYYPGYTITYCLCESEQFI